MGSVDEKHIDATLLNEPLDIAAMKAGQRGRHDPSRLTDWVIMTPAGQINPRETAAIRLVRKASRYTPVGDAGGRRARVVPPPTP